MIRKLVAAMSLLSFGSAFAADIVTNGSFETTTGFVASQQGSMPLYPGSTALSGWSVINSSGRDLAWIGPSNPFGISAPSGSFSLDLTGWHDSSPYSGVSQMLTTISGHTYSLGFDLGHFNGAPASMSVSAGSLSSFAVTGGTGGTGNVWDLETFTFKANSSNTLLSLVGRSASASGTYIGLDNVTVRDVTPMAPVPEPETYAMMLAGLGLLGFVNRRKTSQEAA